METFLIAAAQAPFSFVKKAAPIPQACAPAGLFDLDGHGIVGMDSFLLRT
jgi:hypothetical protein